MDDTTHALLATILHKLYEQDIIEETVILEWHKNPTTIEDSASNQEKVHRLCENQVEQVLCS